MSEAITRMLSEAADGCDVEDLCFNLIDGSWVGVVVEVCVQRVSYNHQSTLADDTVCACCF